MNDTQTKWYTFEELLKDNRINKIEIPRIQRDYAQGRADEKTKRIRRNFVSALYTAITNEKTLNLDFIYGNIDNDGTLTLLDGQQRLTTLFLLHWYTVQKTERADSELLKKFSYKIRLSTRDFCIKLLDFNPFSRPEKNLSEENSKISYEITKQNWFLSSWNKDPSIVSMLTMLDEIHHHFKNSSVTWEDLAKITFYFLPLEDMGLTDDLYIKMNSRGKPLTDFEHFKAELDEQLSKIDNANELASRIRSKFDTKWTDLLWNYRNSGTNTENDNIVDDEFLQYIHFICDVIYYKNETNDKENKINHNQWNEFNLLKNFFTVQENNDEQKVKENFKTLEKYFDCWREENLCGIKCITPKEFLSSFINEKKEEDQQNKIITNKIGNDIFKECLAKYTINKFTLQQFVFLYAVTYYLQHTEIGYDKFVRRIRIINNLIQNSDTEITKNRMNNILKHVEEILDTGEIEEKQNTFNKYQLAEEKHKLALLKIHPKFSDDLFKLEGHELLYGQISILFNFEEEITQKDKEIIQEYINTAKKFIPLFKCDYDKIDCALMSIGNYSQKIRYEYDWRWRYQFASTTNPQSWKELFHQKDIRWYYNNAEYKSNDFAETRNILLKLLEEIGTNTDKIEIENFLEKKIHDFILECESNKLYPFKYYYIKYNTFRQGNGNFHKYGDEYAYHVFTSLTAKATYNPFLREACGEKLFNKYKAFNQGQRKLQFETCYLQHLYFNENGIKELSEKCHITLPIPPQDLFVIYNNNHEPIMPIIINQTEEKIDTENRIDKLKKYIALILKHEDAATLKEYLETNYKE